MGVYDQRLSELEERALPLPNEVELVRGHLARLRAACEAQLAELPATPVRTTTRARAAPRKKKRRSR